MDHPGALEEVDSGEEDMSVSKELPDEKQENSPRNEPTRTRHKRAYRGIERKSLFLK